MPVYEFACNSCGARVSVFVRSVNAPVTAACERCGGTDLRRLISKFAVLRGPGGGNLEGLEAMMGDFDENDPRAMASWAREMQRESGEDLGPEFDEMVGRLERGDTLDDDFDSHDHGSDDGLI